MTANLRSNIRNFLYPATYEQLKEELLLSKSRNDTWRTRYVHEMIIERRSEMSRSLNVRYIGCTVDGMLIYEDKEYPSDAPQIYISDTALKLLSSSADIFSSGKYFVCTARHATVHQLPR